MLHYSTNMESLFILLQQTLIRSKLSLLVLEATTGVQAQLGCNHTINHSHSLDLSWIYALKPHQD
jgi:hypothetical protein